MCLYPFHLPDQYRAAQLVGKGVACVAVLVGALHYVQQVCRKVAVVGQGIRIIHRIADAV
ncbi:hypothetical protein [uncultured Bacteroides sp.]|uniref:hypothetical protein n=1 Tax=uncultured Bacteroides sp. TaxID=162156 RepID=UPI00342D73ED